MLDALAAAAAAARRASSNDRDVEIVLTEEGFVVRGRTIVNRGADSGERRAGLSATLDWPEFEGNPTLLENSVNLVVDRLQRTERGRE